MAHSIINETGIAGVVNQGYNYSIPAGGFTVRNPRAFLINESDSKLRGDVVVTVTPTDGAGVEGTVTTVTYSDVIIDRNSFQLLADADGVSAVPTPIVTGVPAEGATVVRADLSHYNIAWTSTLTTAHGTSAQDGEFVTLVLA